MSGCLSINGEFSFLNVPCSFEIPDVEEEGGSGEVEGEGLGLELESCPASTRPISPSGFSSSSSSCPSKVGQERDWIHPPTPPAGSSSPRNIISPHLYLCCSLSHLALVDDKGEAKKVFKIKEIHSLNVKKSLLFFFFSFFFLLPLLVA